MFKKILRKPYKKLLKKLTTRVLQKHSPIVIVVTGDGQTSIAREMVYAVMKHTFPVRRNLESPEAEFSVPLTILGYEKYPTSGFDWILVLFRGVYNLHTLKPYKHVLVLELNFITDNLIREWLELTKPETILIVGGIPIDYTVYKFKKIIKLSSNESNNFLGPFKIAVRQIARFYNISNDKVDETYENFSLPPSKIRFFPGKNNTTILDATHYYFPIKLEAVLEMVDPQEDRIIIFSKISQDQDLLHNKKFIHNPINYKPEKNDLIILRGEKSKVIPKYESLFAKNSPLL